MEQREFNEIYEWVNSFKLSRPKKNFSRDFSDGVLMAEIVHLYFPEFVELHNYPAANSISKKIENWRTLNRRTFSRIDFHLSDEDCIKLANSTPEMAEKVLMKFKEHSKNKQLSRKSNFMEINEISGVNHLENKPQEQEKDRAVENLRKILGLIKDKISHLEKSIQMKDGHIRQLEMLIAKYTEIHQRK